MAIDLRKILFMQQAQNEQNQNNLLSTNQAQSGLLGGLMSDPTARLLIGANLIGAGVKGSDPFSAITPAVLQTAQIQKALKPKGFRQLSKSEKESRGLPVNKEFQLDTNTNKVSQIGGSGVTVNMQKPIQQGMAVANQYQKESKKFIDRNASRTQILALTDLEGRTAQNDFDTVYAYYKFLDPGSTVRETEFENLEKLGSVGRRISKIIPKWTKGRLLTDAQVTEIRESMEKQFGGFAEEQDERYNRFKNLLVENKLNPDNYLQNYTSKKKTTETKKIDYSKLSNQELLEIYYKSLGK